MSLTPRIAKRVDAIISLGKAYFGNWVGRITATATLSVTVATYFIGDMPSHMRFVLSTTVMSIGFIFSIFYIHYFETRYSTLKVIDYYGIQSLNFIYNNERIARIANRIARAHFGKGMGFPYEDYREWRRKNESSFAAMLTEGGDFIGFVDIFPLRDEAGQALRTGVIYEHELGIEDIYSNSELIKANYIHVASVVCCVMSDLAEAAVLYGAVGYIKSLFPVRDGRVYIAIGGTNSGERVLKRMGFRVVVPRGIAVHGKPIFELNPTHGEQGARALELESSPVRITLNQLPVIDQ